MRPHGAIAVALVAITFAVFFQVREHEFVNLDDNLYIRDNPNLRAGLSLGSVLRAFSAPYEANWIPLTWISLQIDHELYGLEPAGYHLTNVALHAMSAVLLFLALARMTGGVWPSAFVAAVFAVHPLHVESVAWAAERKDALSGLFWMLALHAYGRYAERPGSAARYALVLACLAMGLLAKPMVVTLPFALLLLDYWPLNRLRSDPSRRLPDPERLRRAVLEKLPMLALVAAASAVTLAVQRSVGAMSYGELVPFPLRLGNALESYVVYLAKSVWPTGLGVFYPHPFRSPAGWQAAAAGALLAAVTALVARAAAARPYLAVGWLWYLGTLVPVIGLVQVSVQARADRYMYLPLIGLAVMVAWGAADLAERRRAGRAALGAAGAAAVAGLAACAWLQVTHWRDSMALFERALAVTEKNFVAHYRLGLELQDADRLEEAEAHFAEAARLDPPWEWPYIALADIRARRGELGEALRQYERARRRFPKSPNVETGLGLVLISAGRFDEAHPHLKRALALGAESAELHAGLALIAAQRGRAEAAVSHNRRALELKPGLPNAANNLAWILATSEDEALRDPGEAIRLAEAAVQDTRERDPAFLDTLAAAQAAAGRFEEATRTAERAARIAADGGAEAMAEGIRARLALYRARRPYVEASSPSGG